MFLCVSPSQGVVPDLKTMVHQGSSSQKRTSIFETEDYPQIISYRNGTLPMKVDDLPLISMALVSTSVSFLKNQSLNSTSARRHPHRYQGPGHRHRKPLTMDWVDGRLIFGRFHLPGTEGSPKGSQAVLGGS